MSGIASVHSTPNKKTALLAITNGPAVAPTSDTFTNNNNNNNVESDKSEVGLLDIENILNGNVAFSKPSVITNIKNYTVNQLEYLFDNLSESYA